MIAKMIGGIKPKIKSKRLNSMVFPKMPQKSGISENRYLKLSNPTNGLPKMPSEKL